MNEGTYLNEERYQKTKKKISKASLIVLIISIMIGGALIAAGFIATNISEKNVKKINQERYNEAYKQSQEKVEKAKARLSEINPQVESLKAQISSMTLEISQMQNEKNMIFRDDRGFSDRYYAKDNEIKLKQSEKSKLQEQLDDLEAEQKNLQNSNYAVYYNVETATDYKYLSIIGGIVIVFGGLISLIIYIISKKREIAAYSVQSAMPIAQEGIEKITPTIGNAAQEISKGITEGIQEGSNNSDEK